MTTIKRPNVKKVLAGLKDFQRDSVDYVFERLFGPDAASRFLLADEVGLGKTLVARGVIARVVDHLWDRQERIDIAYICSSDAIARQNISRLNITGHDDFQLTSRLTLLPTAVRNLERNRLNFITLTPGTSFNLHSNLGTMEERLLLYRLLQTACPQIGGTGPMNVLEGGVGRDRFRQAIRQHGADIWIDRGLTRAFVQRLRAHDREAGQQGPRSYRQRFKLLAEQFRGLRPGRVSAELREERARLVGELRALLAATCIQALQPDLVILDEFQRFKDLLHGQSDAGELARHLFEAPDTRILLLSATPYKMYTVSHEAEQDDHHADFLATLRFLSADQAQTAELQVLLGEYRRQLYRLADGGGGDLERTRQAIETRLRRVMARTERLAVTEDRDGMLREVTAGPAPLTCGDVQSFAHLQRVARLLEQGSAVEYWKSAPYVLNFMEHYELKRRLRDRLEDPDPDSALRQELARSNGLLLPWPRLQRYQAVEPGNPRLRALMAELIETGAWQMLWLTPSLPYYQLSGPFSDGTRQRLTKRLVFSSWKVVPRALSALLSYEAERQVMRLDRSAPGGHGAYGRHKPLLNFARSEGRLAGMPVLVLLYPSPSLARLGDPLPGSGDEPLGELPSLHTLLAQVRDRITPRLAPILAGYGRAGDSREDEAWYWAAPLLLDLQEDPAATRLWFADRQLADCWSNKAGEEGWSEHLAEARRLLAGGHSLGRPPADLASVLAKLALAGPAVCALRALGRVMGGSAAVNDAQVRHAAGRVAWGLRSLFNLPTSTILLRGLSKNGGAEPYWQRVLNYSLAGGLTSVLDEFAHVLRDTLGEVGGAAGKLAADLAEEMIKAVGLRAATPGVDVIRAGRAGVRIDSRRLRARFAMRFGDERVDETAGHYRADDVRRAFNSPFWPFVLATTSVGQEGLDFHPYCHAVVHWNLPTNPVDLEQREGRVHRYKGHAVRRNVARRHGRSVRLNDQADPWEVLFQEACREPGRTSDLRPFWVYPLEGGAVIERHVPALPMSREVGQLAALRRSLTLYRMVFGQPRQEDLLEYLRQRVPPSQLAAALDRLRIDLSPPVGRAIE